MPMADSVDGKGEVKAEKVMPMPNSAGGIGKGKGKGKH